MSHHVKSVDMFYSLSTSGKGRRSLKPSKKLLEADVGNELFSADADADADDSSESEPRKRKRKVRVSSHRLKALAESATYFQMKRKK